MTAIPKLVHVTYISEESIPDHWRESIMAWENFGWIVFFHSDQDNDELIANHYPEYMTKYSSFRYKIQKIDFVRLCYLDHWGGVYADLDLVPLEDLYRLLQYPCSVLKNPYGHVYFTNMFMAGQAGHPFWRFYMDHMTDESPWWAVGKHLHVMSTTGPLKMSKCLREFKEPVHILPDTWIQDSVCHSSSRTDVKLKAVEGQSWNEWDSHLYNFFLCKYVVFEVVIALILIIVVILLK